MKKVGKAQKEADEELVKELEECVELPKGEEDYFLYAEADGVFVRETEKKKNGNRVSLTSSKVMITAEPTV